MKRDKLIIYILVGVMVFSAVATGLLFVAQGDPAEDSERAATESELSEQLACRASDEVANQTGQPAGDWPASVETPVSGLQRLELREGTGAAAQLDNCITVHYRLSLADGTPVAGNDSFDGASPPLAFELAEGSLIAGWTEGIPGLKEGGVRRLIVPAALAYGDTERPGIPAGSDLVFDVELVKIEF